MFAKMRSPVTLAGAELDNYLSRGWFRMRQNIFTTSFLQFNNCFYSVIWLRVALQQEQGDKKKTRLHKINAAFRTEIKQADVTPAHEELYQAYRKTISFEVSPSLQELLLGTESYNRYDTYEINVYDAEVLIAAGFFDLGKSSAAGISSMYHPDYRKHSLGKYLIHLKLEFCRQQHLNYFYPGYLVPGYKAFDYKTEIERDRLEYLHLPSRQWLPYRQFSTDLHPLDTMIAMLQHAKNFFQNQNILCSLLYYKFFDANLDPGFYGNELLDFPVFLYCYPLTGSFDYHLIVFDVRDGNYHLLQCSAVINLDYHAGVDDIFSSGLLRVDKDLAAVAKIEELKPVLVHYL
ncbi:MAG: arginyl-tRNA--protein arginylyltransferase [Bacteroidota bacterium]